MATTRVAHSFKDVFYLSEYQANPDPGYTVYSLQTSHLQPGDLMYGVPILFD